VLCFLDLDQFKVVNDTCGHRAGDELLRGLSAALRHGLRSSDVLARLGGDEFGVLLRACPLEVGVRIANDLCRAVEQYPFRWDGRMWPVGVSIGVVPLDAGCGDLAAVLRAADVACYAAKDAGRGVAHVYTDRDDQRAQRRTDLQTIASLRAALADDRLELFFQPISPIGVDGRSGWHGELLLRMWEGDTLLSAASFLPAAERYDVMPLVDRWVVRAACHQLAGRYGGDATTGDLYAINLSGASLNDETFGNFVEEVFAETGLSPTLICFEVTETVAIADIDRAVRFMERMRALGCRFSLDDFGTGLSSLSYLKNLPVDFLKLDGAFVRNVVSDAADLALVDAVNRVGHVMGMQTIAEFVENDAILHRLRVLGVDFAQGWAVGRPFALSEHLAATALELAG